MMNAGGAWTYIQHGLKNAQELTNRLSNRPKFVCFMAQSKPTFVDSQQAHPCRWPQFYPALRAPVAGPFRFKPSPFSPEIDLSRCYLGGVRAPEPASLRHVIWDLLFFNFTLV